MNRIAVLGAAVLTLAATQAPAAAQDAKPSTGLTPEQRDHGIETFRVIASAMQSPNVPNDVKSALMGCIYENPVGKISDTVDKVIAANPGKVDRTKPDQMLGVIAQICGYEPKEAAGAAVTPKTPTPPSGAAKGR